MKSKILLGALIVVFALAIVINVYAAKQNDGTGTINQNKQQAQTATNSTSTTGQWGQINAEQHRSVVANFVQTILSSTSATTGGIGQQVRVIVQQQNQSASTTIQAIEKVQKRSKIKIFLIGSDYKNLGTLRSEMVQTRNRLEQLNRLMEGVNDEVATTEIQSQIQTLEQERTRIENFVKAEEGRFSLFGWFIKIFNR